MSAGGVEITTLTRTRPAEQNLAGLIASSLEDDKAEDVTRIELQGKSSFADCMIIASGRSARHVKAVTDHLVERLKAAGHARITVEGTRQCDWVLVDAGDIVVHIFRPEVRAFYNLEKMWSVPLPEQEAAGQP
ncbi:MAG: ribosome silencing factor [Acetobacterales bacterium]